MKYVTITFKILAHKFYQSYFRNNYFKDYNTAEINNLTRYIMSREFKNIIQFYICSPELNNEFVITSISTNYTSNDYYINIDVSYTGQLTNDEVKKEIEESTWHWFNNSSLRYGNEIIFTTSCNNTIRNDHEHDTSCNVQIRRNPSGISKRGCYDFNVVPDQILIK